MIIPTPIIAAIESTINALFKMDGESLDKLVSLSNKIIRLQITGIDTELYFLPSATGVDVLANYPQDAEVDATIRGSIGSLLALSASTDSGKTLLESDAEIEGDIRVAEKFSSILSEVNIDWEELLSHAIGDIAAHKIGSTIGSFSSWFNDTTSSMRLNASEYLTEESKTTPTSSEINTFLEQVDDLKIDLDRLEARVTNLIIDNCKE